MRHMRSASRATGPARSNWQITASTARSAAVSERSVGRCTSAKRRAPRDRVAEPGQLFGEPRIDACAIRRPEEVARHRLYGTESHRSVGDSRAERQRQQAQRLAIPDVGRAELELARQEQLRAVREPLDGRRDLHGGGLPSRRASQPAAAGGSLASIGQWPPRHAVSRNPSGRSHLVERQPARRRGGGAPALPQSPRGCRRALGRLEDDVFGLGHAALRPAPRR